MVLAHYRNDDSGAVWFYKADRNTGFTGNIGSIDHYIYKDCEQSNLRMNLIRFLVQSSLAVARPYPHICTTKRIRL